MSRLKFNYDTLAFTLLKAVISSHVEDVPRQVTTETAVHQGHENLIFAIDENIRYFIKFSRVKLFIIVIF